MHLIVACFGCKSKRTKCQLLNPEDLLTADLLNLITSSICIYWQNTCVEFIHIYEPVDFKLYPYCKSCPFLSKPLPVYEFWFASSLLPLSCCSCHLHHNIFSQQRRMCAAYWTVYLVNIEFNVGCFVHIKCVKVPTAWNFHFIKYFNINISSLSGLLYPCGWQFW